MVMLLRGGAGEQPREYPDDVRVIACVGRLEHVKGFDLAIDAAHELANESDDFRLVIIGDGSLKAALLEQVAKLGLRDHVSLLGFRDDIASYLAHADVVLMPSRHEGLPFVLLESMALGTPVVAANTGAPRAVKLADRAILEEKDRVGGVVRRALVRFPVLAATLVDVGIAMGD